MRNQILLAVLLSLAGVTTAADKAPSALEQLFEAGRYPEFLSTAVALAEKDDPDALFLLGKAYHLGKGVDADMNEARFHYKLAAYRKNARAINNLGAIALEHDIDPRSALEYFEQAIALGLHSPSTRNAQDARKMLCTDDHDQEMCILAGDVYLEAWRANQEGKSLEDAVTVFSTACVVARQHARNHPHEIVTSNAQAHCQRAIELAEKGADLGLSRATYNRGAIAYDDKRYEEAIRWFKRADQLDLGLAPYTLARMHEQGHGFPKSYANAIAWFKRGAALKEKRAIERMVAYWDNQIENTFDPALINYAVSELEKAQPGRKKSDEAMYRLALIDTLQRNAREFPTLAKKPVRANFCPQDIELHSNTNWRIFAVTRPEDTNDSVDAISPLATGKVDNKGCVTLAPKALKNVRQAMANGRTPLFNWPGQRHLLTLASGDKGTFVLKIGTDIRY